MKFSCFVDIKLDRDEVIALFDNSENMKYWQDGFVSYKRVSGREGEVGSKSMILYNQNGRKMELKETLKVYNLPEELTGFYEHDMMDNRMQNLFSINADGTTRWTANIHYTRVKSFMKIFAWIVPSMFQKQVQKWMDQFKHFAENGNPSKSLKSVL